MTDHAARTPIARLTDSLRRVIDRMVGTTAPPEMKRLERRKVDVVGRIEHDGVVCAEAKGLFVAVDFDRID